MKETKSEYKLRKAIGRKSHEEITKEISNRIDIHLVKAKCISLYKTVFLKKKQDFMGEIKLLIF